MAKEQKLGIIVIDNNETDKIILRKSFENADINYSLNEFKSAKEAWNEILLNKSNCLFIDYKLPDTNGLKLLKKIRAHKIMTPTVIVTSKGDEKIAVEIMKAGAEDYIVKDRINAANIKKIINSIIHLQEIERKRHETEFALQKSQLRLKEAQKIAKIGNWEYTFENNNMYWSEEMYEIFEVDPKTYVPDGEYFMKVFHPDDSAKIREGIDRAISGEVINLDLRIRMANGETKFVNFNAYFQYDEDDNYKNFVGTVQDITQRKLDEKELVEAKKIAEELGKVKEQFLANMSHEIRTPLNAIIGFANLLLKKQENLNSEQRQFINSIHTAGKNLMVIINDILDFSKIQSGKLKVESIDFEIKSLLNDLMHLFKPKADEKDLDFVISVDPKIPNHIKGDPVRLNQILVNILSNAIKFTSEGSVRLDVKKTKKESKKISISFKISDTGIGIHKKQLETIFESFTQASSNTTRKFGGTGLGLTIVKSLIEILEGDISVYSEPEKGTSFTVSLTFEESNQYDPSNLEIVDENFITENYPKDIKALMAEDNEMNQELAKAIFLDIGWGLDIAENGRIAVDKLRENQYDIVLMDIQMPKLDGYETTQWIRNEFDSPLCDIPIIAITAHAYGKEIRKCFDAGMNDYISKPFEVSNLKNKIIQLLKKNEGPTNTFKSNETVIKNRQQIINLDYLHNVSGNNSKIISNILDMLVSQTPERIDNLKKYIVEEDWKDLQELCHKMKSSYALIGAQKLKKQIEMIENDCRNNNFDKEKFTDRIFDIEKMNRQVIDSINMEICAIDLPS